MRLDRIERDIEILIDIIECENQPDLKDTSLACRTVDVSEHGMKVKSSMDLPVSTRLGMRLDMASQLYRLEGEVRWSKEEGLHYIGLLIDTESADYVPWSRMFQLGL